MMFEELRVKGRNVPLCRGGGGCPSAPPTLKSHLFLFLSLLEKKTRGRKAGLGMQELGAQDTGVSAAASEDLESEVKMGEGVARPWGWRTSPLSSESSLG